MTIHRSRGHATYPARIQLVMAANPCPCARPAGDTACECSALHRRRYLARLSGPLLDRIDLRVTLPPLTSAQLAPDGAAESSGAVLARVLAARQAAAERWARLGRRANAEVSGAHLRDRAWRLPPAVTRQLVTHLDRGTLSARGLDRVVRVAWSVADLDGRDRPGADDVAEAMYLRGGLR